MKKKIHYPDVTKQAIKNAFVKLLELKPYNRITVAELTREAGINRVTFYSHYCSIEELMDEIEVEPAEKVLSLFSDLFQSENFHDKVANEFLDIFLSSPEIRIWFLQNHTTGKGFRILYESSRELCVNEWKKHKEASEEELFRIFDFYFYGSMAYLENWLRNGSKENEKEFCKGFTDLTGHFLDYIWN